MKGEQKGKRPKKENKGKYNYRNMSDWNRINNQIYIYISFSLSISFSISRSSIYLPTYSIYILYSCLCLYFLCKETATHTIIMYMANSMLIHANILSLTMHKGSSAPLY